MLKKNDIITLEISDMNNLGNGVGRYEGIVIFVSGAVVGDICRAKIIKVTKSFCVARTEEIMKRSEYRDDKPFCNAPQSCGGCVFRNIRYDCELERKKEYVESAFRKAGLGDVKVSGVRSTGVRSGYRNKAQYPVRNGKGRLEAGFYAGKSHDIVGRSGDCVLEPKIFSEIVDETCSFFGDRGIDAYREETGKGIIRHIYLRRGEMSGEIMLCVVINADDLACKNEFAAHIVKKFGDVKSVMLNINKKNTNVVLGEKYINLYGEGYISDTLCGLDFKITPASFYQVNHDGAELLYSLAKEKAFGESGRCGTLLDLYCGIGTIGLSMADRADSVIGVEIVKSAVECACKNAEANGIPHAEFYCGDATDIGSMMASAERSRGKAIVPDVVIMDPPRKGSDRGTIEYIASRNVGKVVYISCNPDTLARDAVIFRELGYDIGEVTPVDMFPATGHVESVVMISKKQEQ